MKKYWITFLCFIAFSPLLHTAGEVVVHLPKDCQEKQNVYLATLAPCENDYQRALFEVLNVDFIRDGRSKLVDQDGEKDFLAHHKDPVKAFQVSKWRTWDVRYLVIPKVTNKELVIQIFDIQNASLKTLYPFSLTGRIEHDRRVLHKASDAIHEVLYKKPGIASKRILYSYQPKLEPEESGHWYAEIWEMGYDGHGTVQLTSENHYTITPAFVPDTDSATYQFLYVTYKQGQPRIYMTSRDASRGKPLIPLQGNQLLPTLSTQGDRVAFICDAAGRADLFVQSFNRARGVTGKPVQVFSSPGSVQASPSFNPDGSQIAFVSDTSGTPRIYIIDLEQVLRDKKRPTPKLISKQCSDNSGPCWSPEGDKIAYSAKTNGVRQIWIYDIKNDEEHQLTTGVGNKENPYWAPNSRHLVYNTTSPTFDIFLIEIHNTNPIRLTDGPGIKHFPVFEP